MMENLQNQIYENMDSHISVILNEHFRDGISSELSWIDIVAKKLSPTFFDIGDKVLIRNFARLLFQIGPKLGTYKNFITDGSGGILVEHFLSEVLLHKSEEGKSKYNPPKEITIAGGEGSEKRIDSIKQALAFEGIDLTQPTLLISEMFLTGNKMKKIFASIEGFRNMDICLLGCSGLGINSVKGNLSLSDNSEVFVGGDREFFRKKDDYTGFTKNQNQTGAYTEAYVPRRFGVVEEENINSSYFKIRKDLSILAKALLPLGIKQE